MARLALFQHEPYCSRDCCAGIISALSSCHEVTILGLRDLKRYFLEQFDMVIFPGGRGEASHFHTLFRHHEELIRSYIKNGGRYLGICMGAYWADEQYFNLLQDLRCAQYITRPHAEIRRSYPTLARINWQSQMQTMYFFDGCTFTGDLSHCEVIARYANGDPMAIIQRNIGVIGCHPESEAHWYHSKAMKNAWHEFRHHQLLLDFVNRMLSVEQMPTVTSKDNHLKIILDSLQNIVDLTQPFAHGTHQKVNSLANTALNEIKLIMEAKRN